AGPQTSTFVSSFAAARAGAIRASATTTSSALRISISFRGGPCSYTGRAGEVPIRSDGARPEGLQGLRRPRDLPDRARRGGRIRDRASVRRAVRDTADRGRPRHARLLADDGEGRDGGRRGSGGAGARPRAR